MNLHKGKELSDSWTYRWPIPPCRTIPSSASRRYAQCRYDIVVGDKADNALGVGGSPKVFRPLWVFLTSFLFLGHTSDNTLTQLSPLHAVMSTCAMLKQSLSALLIHHTSLDSSRFVRPDGTLQNLLTFCQFQVKFGRGTRIYHGVGESVLKWFCRISRKGSISPCDNYKRRQMPVQSKHLCCWKSLFVRAFSNRLFALDTDWTLDLFSGKHYRRCQLIQKAHIFAVHGEVKEERSGHPHRDLSQFWFQSKVLCRRTPTRTSQASRQQSMKAPRRTKRIMWPRYDHIGYWEVLAKDCP